MPAVSRTARPGIPDRRQVEREETRGAQGDPASARLVAWECCPVEQEDRQPARRALAGRSGPGWAGASDDDIVAHAAFLRGLRPLFPRRDPRDDPSPSGTHNPGVLLAVPLASVSVLAWILGNPFNGTLLAVASLALAALALRLPDEPVHIYAAPTGLVPSPTLSAVVGLARILGGLGSRGWSLVVATIGVLYGVIGAFRLGVTIDLVLLSGAIALAVGAVATPRAEQAPTVARRAATPAAASQGDSLTNATSHGCGFSLRHSSFS